VISSTYPIGFSCEGERLQAMLHAPAEPRDTGVLVVVGGPQYRVGSHRQFVLLGRALAGAGFPVLRFDYRGLGDSTGALRTFEHVQLDVRAAIDELFRRVPALRRVVIWGLCDAASAAMFYAASDSRVAGLALLNPWARSEQTVAQAYLRHYYLRRLVDASAWRALLSGAKSPLATLRSIFGTVRAATRAGGEQSTTSSQDGAQPPLTERMRRGLADFDGPVLLILSGDDITAAEFRSVAGASRQWRKLLAAPRVSTQELPAADHTFSTRAWRDQVAAWTIEWMESQWPALPRREDGAPAPARARSA
jgi:exosortase A-associated hydrolase 1